MATRMSIADLDLVAAGTPGAQRVAVLDEPFKLRMAWAKVPTAGAGQIRIKIKYVGICGSDLESYRGARAPEWCSMPTRLGHEVSGVIDQIGPGVEGLKVGDRVACRYVWGAFAEWIVCAPFNVHVVPADLPDKDVSPIEVLPGILHAAELAQITTNTDVLIMGQGVSGLVMTQIVHRFSPRSLVVTDLKDRNLELARKYGATHAYKIPAHDARTMDAIGKDFPKGFEVVIPCLLEGDGMIDACDAAALGGRVIMYGCIGTCKRPFDFLRVHRKRLSIISTEPRRDIDMRRYFKEGCDLVTGGLVNLSEMVTDVYPFSQVAEAFARRDNSAAGAIHVLVDCTR